MCQSKFSSEHILCVLHTKFTLFCECCVSQQLLLEAECLQCLLWLRAALIPFSIILELHVSFTNQQIKPTDFYLENLKWGSKAVPEAQLLESSYLNTSVLSAGTGLRTLAQVLHMSDCFPSFVHFGKDFPVEEINKFQDDISAFVQKNKEKKSLPALFSVFNFYDFEKNLLWIKERYFVREIKAKKFTNLCDQYCMQDQVNARYMYARAFTHLGI